jgi:hypothetical protein
MRLILPQYLIILLRDELLHLLHALLNRYALLVFVLSLQLVPLLLALES